MIVETKGEYLAPEIKVIPVKYDKVVCASATNPFSNPDSEENW